MAFYLAETDDFKKKEDKDRVMSFEEICRVLEKEGAFDG